MRQTLEGGARKDATAHFAYDAAGNLVRTIDPLGNTHRYGYDSRGNRVWESDAEGPLVADGSGAFNGTINDHGNTIQHRYDGLGRLVETDGLGLPPSALQDSTAA